MTFNEKYLKIYEILEKEINQVIESLIKDINLDEPIKSKLISILKAPSKHIRPLVSFLYLKAIDKNIDEKQIIYQSAIEIVHNASIIHDDIIDESDKRRGVLTLNKGFSNKIAVLTGDYLLSVALDKILELNQPKLIKLFSETLDVMTKGELVQQANLFKIPTIESYIKKSEQKTAKLFETSLLGSLIIADVNDNDKNFAKNFGIAFQIRDDLINYQTSKSDIKDGIYTAPIIYSDNLENCSVGIEKTKILLSNYIDNALDTIIEINDNKYKEALINLLELLRYE